MTKIKTAIPPKKPNVKTTPLGGSRPGVASGYYRLPELILKNYGYWEDYKQYVPSYYEDKAKQIVKSHTGKFFAGKNYEQISKKKIKSYAATNCYTEKQCNHNR